MSCFDEDIVSGILRRGLLNSAPVQEHIDQCADCRRLVAAVIRMARVDSPQGEPVINDSTLPLGENDISQFRSDGQLFSGSVVDHRYVVEERLGEGGMGTVWAARRTDTGERVALKAIRLFDAESIARVEREARIAQRLAHPNIVRIHEVLTATHERGPILVMDLLRGLTLKQLLQQDVRYPLRETARLFAPVISTLEAAHAEQIVHRDLKPENIFKTLDQDVYVLDFGLARLLPSSEVSKHLTRSGAVLGTPRYMAPEQIFGERSIDCRADIWSLGVTLYETLTGRHPIPGNTMGELMRFMQAPRIDPVTRWAPTIPPDIAALLTRALSRDPDRRPQSVTEFIAPISIAAR